MSTAWVLNLDAELELADPEGYQRSTRLATRMAGRAAALVEEIAAWTRGEVVILNSNEPSQDATPRTWCPTPSALATVATAGLPAPRSPPLAILQRVNHRAFQENLDTPLPGACFVRSMADLDRVLTSPTPPSGWLLKRPFGFSGRWRKTVTGPLSPADTTWTRASMTRYGSGLQVEPMVTIDAEFALHGWIGTSGGMCTGEPTILQTGPDGAWAASEPAGPALGVDERRRLEVAAQRVAVALVAVGYHGPFGIDAFRWRDAERHRFHALGELNARFTMGWFGGMLAIPPSDLPE